MEKLSDKNQERYQRWKIQTPKIKTAHLANKSVGTFVSRKGDYGDKFEERGKNAK